jgi:hypothetical protein
MGFEPLKTDEKLDKPPPKQRSFDDLMLLGCGGFLIASVGGYLLGIWPFFLWQNAEKLDVLLRSTALGLIFPLILGVAMARRSGLAGATGAIGGSLVTAIFLYLRIEQTFLEAAVQRIPTPDYPASLQFLLPIGWVMLVSGVTVAFLPREEA